jgi:POT family proton-dependent oligopeptide transporter
MNVGKTYQEEIINKNGSTKSGFPKGLPFIVSNEAAERFSFYGMSSILPTFLVAQFFNPHHLKGLETFAEAKANAQTHFFVTLAYFLPLLGGMAADWFFGKYKVILYVSIVYCFGHLLLSILDENLNGFIWGLVLIAIGAGGIKSCVSANLGDQFTYQNQHLLSKAYGWFYFSINVGSVLATVFIPYVYHVYGPKWAFGIPGILMAMATLIFVSGRKTYRIIPPKGIKKDNFWVVHVCLIRIFIRSWFGKKKVQKPWKAQLQNRFSEDTLDGVEALWRILLVLLFVPIFWAMWYQSLSEWVIQAYHLNLSTGIQGLTLLPEQVQTLNPFFLVTGIPLFTYLIYPKLEKFGIKVSPLRKIGSGLFFIGLSFVVIALVQARVDLGEHPTVYWQLLAYLLVSISEILISVTCLEYAYTQSPASMKSTMTAIWWLTLSIGNLFTALVNKSISEKGIFSSFTGARYYWLFVWILLGFFLIFVLVSKNIKEKTYLLVDETIPQGI